MKVLLLQDVKKYGRKGEVVNVPDGYGHNFLIPKKLARQANNATAAAAAKNKASKKAATNDRTARYHDIIEALDGALATLSAKASDTGALYAVITKEEVLKAINTISAETVAQDLLPDVPKIKQTGQYDIILSFAGKQGTVSLTVEAQA